MTVASSEGFPSCSHSEPSNTGTPMARKPNYDFERRERERLKQQKTAAKEAEKAKPAAEEPAAENGTGAESAGGAN